MHTWSTNLQSKHTNVNKQAHKADMPFRSRLARAIHVQRHAQLLAHHWLISHILIDDFCPGPGVNGISPTWWREWWDTPRRLMGPKLQVTTIAASQWEQSTGGIRRCGLERMAVRKFTKVNGEGGTEKSTEDQKHADAVVSFQTTETMDETWGYTRRQKCQYPQWQRGNYHSTLQLRTRSRGWPMI